MYEYRCRLDYFYKIKDLSSFYQAAFSCIIFGACREVIFPRYCGHTEGLGRIINLGGVKWKSVRGTGKLRKLSLSMEPFHKNEQALFIDFANAMNRMIMSVGDMIKSMPRF